MDSAKTVIGRGRPHAFRRFEHHPRQTSCASPSETTSAGALGSEELAHLPVAFGEKLVRASDVLHIERLTMTETRDARVEDRQALGLAVGADHDHDAAAHGPLDLTHEAAAEAALTRRATHTLEAVDLDESPFHEPGTGRRSASPPGLLA